METLRLEINILMINICEQITEAKIEEDFKRIIYLERKLGILVFEAMEDCPF